MQTEVQMAFPSGSGHLENSILQVGNCGAMKCGTYIQMGPLRGSSRKAYYQEEPADTREKHDKHRTERGLHTVLGGVHDCDWVNEPRGLYCMHTSRWAPKNAIGEQWLESIYDARSLYALADASVETAEEV